MKVTNFANLFHQSSIFQQGSPLGQKLVQPPVSGVLRRLSENLPAAQEQFLREGAKELNRIGREGPALDGKSIQMAAGSADVRHSDFQWSIDASAEEIYAEIDSALATVQKGTSLCRDGASRVAAELRRRGREAEGVSLEPQDGPVQRGSLFRSIYDELWTAFRRGAWGNGA